MLLTTTLLRNNGWMLRCKKGLTSTMLKRHCLTSQVDSHVNPNCYSDISAALLEIIQFLMQNTFPSFVRRSMLRNSGRAKALILTSCRTVSWWWLTVGSVARNTVVGLNIGSPTFGDKDRTFSGGWCVQMVAAHRSRAEVDSGRMSQHEWLGNSKTDDMACSGASRYAVTPGDVYAHGAAWDKATDLAHFLFEAGLHICSSCERQSDSKSADVDDGGVAAPVARARLQVTYHEMVWALDRWRCSRCQRYARNEFTPAAVRRTVCMPLLGTARGAAPSLPRVHTSHKLRRSGPITWCTVCGAYSCNRSFAWRQSCPGSRPSDTRLQRLRQMVRGRHPISGAWLLDAPQLV